MQNFRLISNFAGNSALPDSYFACDLSSTALFQSIITTRSRAKKVKPWLAINFKHKISNFSAGKMTFNPMLMPFATEYVGLDKTVAAQMLMLIATRW